MKKFLKALAFLPIVALLLYASQSLWAQTPVKIWRFRSNSGGIDTVAQDSTNRAGANGETWNNAKKFRIGTLATGAAALSNHTGSLQYYDNIAFFLRADTLSTNDTLMCKIYTYDYGDTAYVIPFTSMNKLGTPTADKESLAVSAAGCYVLSITGMTKGTAMPLRTAELRVMINATSTARCIYRVSAQALSKAGQ